MYCFRFVSQRKIRNMHLKNPLVSLTSTLSQKSVISTKHKMRSGNKLLYIIYIYLCLCTFSLLNMDIFPSSRTFCWKFD